MSDSGDVPMLQALRTSEATLRGLFENLPDFVILVDGDANILFANRGQPEDSPQPLRGRWGLGMIAPEHQPTCRQALGDALAAGQTQRCEVLDVFGQWWSCRVVPLTFENGPPQAMIICTDVTRQHEAAEALEKERQLLRRLLELHERQRRLVAYEIHDGFAQQLTGALYRLQAFRESLSRAPAEAWKTFDSAARLLRQAMDEARRVISGLRPPILDESGIVEAIEYLVCEHRQDGGPEIEFEHDVTCGRLPSPLANTIFRVVQESLQNACRHSRSDRIRVALMQAGDRISIDVRDWGVGFDPSHVDHQRFGLQGIRERVRLLDGRVVIESSPGEGTCIHAELPLTDGNDGIDEAVPYGGGEQDAPAWD